MFLGFSSHLIESRTGDIFVFRGGAGPPVLLLHGFPETHMMWRTIAPLLAVDFSVICADLPGYGRSACLPDEPRTRYSKRSMAQALVEAMATLGHDRFAVVGHDRGGRVAYRMALDRKYVVSKLVVLDVIPTGMLWDRADARLTLSFWPFSLLAQPEPLPERLIGSCPEAVIDNALANWGSPPHVFPPDIRTAYVEALSDPAHIHAICEEYRAAASIDRDHDREDMKARRRIACPLLALWSEMGGLNNWYLDEGGPLAIWRALADNVEGGPVAGGHFFPEENPEDTANRLRAFLLS
ncbi:haloacetate dehalogenase [Bradyrhizobium sp. USDA 3311]